jgi:dipeptidyl aminopeptidase/acylaminoacyl peptidase
LEDETITQYLNAYNNYLETYGHGRYSEAPEERQFRQTGRTFMTTLWVYSIEARRPFEFYKNIDIPVLFFQGILDTNTRPVSTKYVEQNLPDKPFDYIYYQDMIHYPETIGELKRLRADIANWLREKRL